MARPRAASTRTEYLPEFGRVVRIVEYDRPMLSDDIETAQTVSYMDEIAAHDAEDPAVMNAAAAALEDAGITLDSAPLRKAHAVYWWLKRTIRYVPTPGTSPLVDQTLITPCTVLAMPEPIGDCPQFSMLASAMFRVLCMDSMFVTIKAEEAIPDQWSHIYNTVEVAPGVYLPFDSSNGPEPGAEYSKPFARKVWPRIAPGRCTTRSKENMLRNSYAGRAIPTMRNRTLRGSMGDLQCDQDGNCYDNGVNVTGSLAATQAMATQGDCAFGTDSNGNCLPGAGVPLLPSPANPTAPTPSSNSSGVLNTLLTDVGSIGTSLVKAATQQKPYYITGPNGQQVLFNPNTGTVSGASVAGTISPTMIVLGLLGLGAVALLGGKK